MRRSLWSSLVLLAAAIMASGARPARAQTSGCTNPYTGVSYCDATSAIAGDGVTCFGFCGDLDFFRRTTGPTPTTGFITQQIEDCLCSAAVNALNLSPSSAARQFQLLRDRMLQILGSRVSSNGTPLVTLPILGPPLTSADTTPLPVAGGGPVLSDCFLRLRCSSPFTCSGSTFATTCDSCEAERRLIARTLAFDLECARVLAAQGFVAAGSNPDCMSTCQAGASTASLSVCVLLILGWAAFLRRPRRMGSRL